MPVSVAPYGITLNAVADPTDSVQLDGTLSDSPEIVGGKVNNYGRGRLRWTQTEAVTRKVPLSLDSVTPAQLAWIEAHKGQLCWLRDPFGRRYAGTYGGFQANPYVAGAGGFHSVGSLTFQMVTRFESV